MREAYDILDGANDNSIVYRNAVDYVYLLDRDQRFVSEMTASLQQSHNAGQKIVIYGYSKGGDLALQISRRLNAKNVSVAALITVDAANGWWSDEVNRSVPNNVRVNYNFYQTKPGKLIPSFGGPNTGVGLIINVNVTAPNINHSNIDEATKQISKFLINSNTK